MKHLLMILAGFLFAAPASAAARTGSITLNVPHIQQQTSQLCWAALVAQALFQNPDGTRPGQCDLVNMLNELKGRDKSDCCANFDKATCDITANQLEIIALITSFGMKAEQLVTVPSTPEEVYNYLKSGRVLLLGVRTTATDNHMYMVRGISWENNEAVLLVNDPYYEHSAKTSFKEAQPTWVLALVVG